MNEIKPMTPREMALKAHENRRARMSPKEISKHYAWVASKRKMAKRKQSNQLS